MENGKTPYYYISKYRTELMGFAILWVVWFHSYFTFDFIPLKPISSVFSFIKNTGYGGVDIFLLVSGMGIYNSLKNNSTTVFFKNRLNKLLPIWWSYFLACLLLSKLFIHIAFSNISLTEMFGFVSLTGFWVNMQNQGNWYVYAVMLLYMFSPALFNLFSESKSKKATCLILLIITLIISFSFINNSKLIFFSRIPLYIIGMFFAASLKERRLQKKHWYAYSVVFIVGLAALVISYYCLSDYLWKYGLWWYPFILIAPTLALIFSCVFDLFNKALKPLLFVFRKTGQASLEILLITEGVFSFSEKIKIGPLSENLTALIMMCLGVAVGLAFHFFVELIKKPFKKLSKV